MEKASSRRVDSHIDIKISLAVIVLAILFVPLAQCQYVTLTGQFQGPNGLPVNNALISMQPDQAGFVGGSTPLVIVPTTAECATSTTGATVLVQNPLQPPQLAPAYSGGTLAAGNYYVKVAWYDAAAHTTLVSPEASVQLSATGQIYVSPPASGMNLNAAGTNIYISSTSGAETLQGTIAGSGTYVQSIPLVTGASPPTTNNTVCTVIANDAMWPSGTGYQVSLTSASGSTMPGSPMHLQFLGPGSTINLGQGLPFYNGTVTYPIPILALPYNHGPQSISGSLSLTGYNLTMVGQLGVGTATPGWGIDVENSGTQSEINAKGGYLVNGVLPTANTCLGSTDALAYDLGLTCMISGFTSASGDLTGTYPAPTVAKIQGQAIAVPTTAGYVYWTGSAFEYLPGIATAANCGAVGSAASPSLVACGSAAAGGFSCATAASTATCVVSTTAVTANSEVEVHQVSYLGARLSVTCNTSSVLPSGPLVTAISAGSGFTIALGTVSTNPGCFIYTIVN